MKARPSASLTSSGSSPCQPEIHSSRFEQLSPFFRTQLLGALVIEVQFVQVIQVAEVGLAIKEVQVSSSACFEEDLVVHRQGSFCG